MPAKASTPGRMRVGERGLAVEHLLTVRGVQRAERVEAGLLEWADDAHQRVDRVGVRVELLAAGDDQRSEQREAGFERRDHGEGLGRERPEERDEPDEIGQPRLLRGHRQAERARRQPVGAGRLGRGRRSAPAGAGAGARPAVAVAVSAAGDVTSVVVGTTSAGATAATDCAIRALSAVGTSTPLRLGR